MEQIGGLLYLVIVICSTHIHIGQCIMSNFWYTLSHYGRTPIVQDVTRRRQSVGSEWSKLKRSKVRWISLNLSSHLPSPKLHLGPILTLTSVHIPRWQNRNGQSKSVNSLKR